MVFHELLGFKERDGALIERYQPPLGPGVAQRFAWSRAVTDEQVAALRDKLRMALDDDFQFAGAST